MKIARLCAIGAVALFAAVCARADTFGSGFGGYVISPVFQNVTVPGQLPPIPVGYGGIAFHPTNPSEFVIGGAAAATVAKFYRLPFVRDSRGHIASSPGTATFFANAPKLASGIVFAPGNVLLYTIESGSAGVDVGMIKPGSTNPNKIATIIPETPGSLNFVPAGFGGAGQLKLLAGNGKFYSVSYTPDGNGTFTLSNPVHEATLPHVNVEGFVYIKGGTPGFPRDSMLVAERILSDIVAFDVDGNGNPIPSTRRLFYWFYPQRAVEGLLVDPQTNDILLTTRNGSSSAIYRFEGGAPTQIRSCADITEPGTYVWQNDTPCVSEVRNTHDVTVNCNQHSAGISIKNSTRFTVVNCGNVRVTNSSWGTITGNHGGVVAESMTNTTVADNDLFNAVHMLYSVNNTLRANHIKCPGYCDTGAVYLSGGRNNLFEDNIVDGNRQPSDATGSVGARSLFFLRGQNGDTYRNNVLKNAWFGFELANGSVPASITGNTITNVRADICGPGTAIPVCPVP